MDRQKIVSFLFILAIPIAANAQDVHEKRDTLPESVVVSDRFVVRDAGTRIVPIPQMRSMVSVTGESDAIKYIQTLPGVSTGAEGASAIYVRGGNIGSNVMTLDGVQIFGGSHLLGLTSIYPSEIVSGIDFRVGGFRGDESNMTASHIRLKTSDGSFTSRSFSASASMFMLGGTVSMPIVKNKVSLIGSVRVSPLGPAFRVVQAIVGGPLDSLQRPRAVACDMFAKVKWLVNDKHNLSLGAFASKDGYSYHYGGRSDESMGWGNFILNARHEGQLKKGWQIEDGLSYNHFMGRQGIVRDMSGTENNLAIVSTIDELTAESTFSRLSGKYSSLRLGVRERFAWFNPGTSATFKGDGPLTPTSSPLIDHTSHSSITTMHGQWNYTRKRFELMTSAKMNVFAADEQGDKWRWRFNPEASILAKLKLAKWLSIEATADWTVQYYHTLEGIPLGWSMDLIVPTNPNRPPEHATQYYAGAFMSFGEHHISVGAYDKKMDGLVYFSDASMLFSSTIAGWSNNVKVGSGTSRGVEFLYEKVGKRLNYRVAYTCSKTDRCFDGVNNGVRFPAKFDRRHILNATANVMVADNEKMTVSLNGLFTFQSGHWETVSAGEYPAFTPFGETIIIDYFTSTNNYRMPDYIRLDIGCNIDFKTRYPQELNIGIYNVLNRHNPFSIIYDDKSREWRQVSLIPIMPSISYKIKF